MQTCNCEYFDDKTSKYIYCDLQALDNDNRCILHSLNKNKSETVFCAKLSKKTSGDFNCYVFPCKVEPKIFSTDIIKEISEKITFVKELNFRGAVFLKGISLSDVIFEKSVDMRDCVFYDENNFKRAEFQDKVDISKSVVEGKLSFDGSSFKKGVICHRGPFVAEPNGEIYFNNVELAGESYADFQYVDMNRWHLIGTDISKLKFSFCKWPTVPTSCNGRSKCHGMLYDEIVQCWNYRPFMSSLQLKKKTNVNYSLEISQMYRDLRMKCEGRLQYQEASSFYIGEMEVRRLALLRKRDRTLYSRAEYLFLSLYKILSDYGENYQKAMLYFIGLILLFAVIFMFAGLKYTTTTTTINYDLTLRLKDINLSETIIDFFRSLGHSFSIATILIKDRQLTYANGVGYFLYIIETCLGAIMMSTILVSIRRNFKRSEKEKFYGE